MPRQRQLHQDAVDLRVGVEPLDQRQQLHLGGGLGQVMRERHHTDPSQAGACCAIDLGRRSLPTMITASPARHAGGLFVPDAVVNLVEQDGGNGLAVEDAGGHGVSVSAMGRRA